MSKGKWAVLLAMVVFALAAGMAPVCQCQGAPETAAAAGPDLSALAKRVGPAVGVLVTLDAEGEPLSQGTAFFVRADGVALTCHHVLEDAASALVRMENGAYFPVEGLLASDPVRDLALFKVTGRDLPTVPLGDSSTLRPGQRVVAITAPRGLENTVADGLVSAVRELPSGPVVQVSVALSSGSSGGPIFDLSGKVVAVAAAVPTEGQALNFAIPINAAKPLLSRPGEVKALAPVEEPADLEEWLREHPATPGQASAYDLWLQGMEANLDERYEEAERELLLALTLDPTLYQAHCCLGSSYGKMGRYEEAIAEYKEAIRVEPDDAAVHYNLGVAYAKLGRYQEALERFKQAIRLKPNFADAHCNLAVAYGRLGRYEEEIAEYKEAIRLEPDHAEAHLGLGLAYYKLGRYREAIAAYKQAIRLEPDLAGAHYGLGVTYVILSDRGAALEEYRILKDLDPELAGKLFACIMSSIRSR